MEIRRLRKQDISTLREIHKAAGYGFKLPLEEKLESSHVIVEDGKVVGWVGAQKTVQVFALFDPKFGSPHRRVNAMVEMAKAMETDLKKKGFTTMHAWIDSQWPRLADHLVRRMRCRIATWVCLWKRI